MGKEIKKALRKKARERTPPEEQSMEKHEKIRRATARLLDVGKVESRTVEEYRAFSKILPPQKPPAVEDYRQYERYRASLEAYEEEKARIEEARYQAMDSYYEAQDELARLCPKDIYYRISVRSLDLGIYVVSAKEGKGAGTVLITPWSEVEKIKEEIANDPESSSHAN